MLAETQSGRHRAAALCAIASLMSVGGFARADDVDSWHEIETKYIFGFTTGSGIGLEGEKEFTTDTKVGSANATVATTRRRRSTNSNSRRPSSSKSNSARSDRPMI